MVLPSGAVQKRVRTSAPVRSIVCGMTLSVTAPIDLALRRTGAILFRPFDGTKWLKLGVCAFLATLGDCAGGSGSSGVRSQVDDLDSSPRHALERAGDWLAENLVLVLTLGLVALVVAAALMLVLLWLQSRGRFMFLDGVVRNRGAVSQPWSEYAAEGNSLFTFSALLSLASAVIALFAVAIGLSLAWSDIQSESFGAGALLALVLGGGTLLLNGVAYSLISLLTLDLVLPAMYARRCGVLAGWRTVRVEILRPHLGAVVLFVLMRIVLGVLTGMLLLMLACGTLGAACCLMMIPFVGTLVVLPILVFTRSYSLAFLEQLGPAWTLVPAEQQAG